jgi:hypothetical protein
MTKHKPTYEITINSDRSTTAGMTVLLLTGVALTISDARHLFWGSAKGQVSMSTILVALYCLALAISLREKLFKLALALNGIQASVRVIFGYAHASPESRHVAAIGGLVLSLTGWLIIIVAAVNWFRSVIRRIPTPEREDPTP